MPDLETLLKDYLDARLKWPTIRREKEEALLTGIVDELVRRRGGRPVKEAA